MTKTELQRAINDIKGISADYVKKENGSPTLAEKIKRLEMELLDEFYTLMSKPTTRRGPVKKAKAKTTNEKAAGNVQL